MNISNDAGGIDSSRFIDYFTKQMPLDLAQMAALRDELERRQGALTAVDEANRAKTDAEAILAKTKIEAADLVTRASAQKQAVDAQLADIASQKTALADQQSTFVDNVKAQNLELQSRKNSADALDAVLAKREADVKAREATASATEAKLASYQLELDGRIKAFQAKVASISA